MIATQNHFSMEYYKFTFSIIEEMDTASHQSRSIGLDALFQYTGSGVQFFSGMIFYLIIVRMFSTTSVGAIALFLAIIGLFQIVFSFGLGAAAQHFTSYSIGKGDYNAAAKVFYRIICYGFAVSIVGFATLFLSSPLISSVFLHSSSYSGLVKLLSVVLLGNILFSILNGTLLGLQNFRLSAFINIVIWVLYYFGSIFLAYFVHSLNALIIGWALGIFLGVLTELVLILKLLSKFKGQSNAVTGQTLMKYSLPIVLSGLIGYGAAYADRFVVAGLLNLSSLGIYNFALLVSSALGFLAAPFNNILMPKFSELYGRGEWDSISLIVRASSLLLNSMYVPAALGIAAISPIILVLLGGLDYEGGAVPLSIIMLISSIFVSQNILVQAIASVRKTRIFLYSSTAAFAANIFFSYLLIPHFGLMGAAFGFSSVSAFTFFVLYAYARKAGLVSFDISGTAKIWLSAIVMFLLVSTLVEHFGKAIYLLPAYILAGFIVFISMARILRLFGKEDKELVLSLFPQNLKRIRKLISTFILH